MYALSTDDELGPSVVAWISPNFNSLLHIICAFSDCFVFLTLMEWPLCRGWHWHHMHWLWKRVHHFFPVGCSKFHFTYISGSFVWMPKMLWKSQIKCWHFFLQANEEQRVKPFGKVTISWYPTVSSTLNSNWVILLLYWSRSIVISVTYFSKYLNCPFVTGILAVCLLILLTSCLLLSDLCMSCVFTLWSVCGSKLVRESKWSVIVLAFFSSTVYGIRTCSHILF